MPNKLKAINAYRKKKNKGKLNATSKKTLEGLCKHHYKDDESQQEQGFVGSLVARWDAQFVTEFDRHPPADEGEETESEDDSE